MYLLLKDYKLRIFFILIIGFFIVSIITAIAAYSIYQSILLEYRMEANKIIKLYETNYQRIIKDLAYLKLIDFQKSDKEIVEKFRKTSSLIYDKNTFINGIGLVKQFKKNNVQQESRDLASLLDDKKIKIFPIVDRIKNAIPAKEDSLYSVVFDRIPLDINKDIRGAELSSEHKRQVIIASMNFTDKYYLTAPVKLINDTLKGYEYSSVLYYPLYKKKGKTYYKWFVSVPMTSQKILNSFVKEYLDFNQFNIQIYDKSDNHDDKYICISNNSNKLHPTQVAGHIILEHILHFANRNRKMVISVDSIFELQRYWTVILGFLSGIIFLIGIGYYLLFKEQKEIEISQLSRTDHLTKVYNRIYFDEQIEYFLNQFLRYENTFSMILLDIDHFKKINDTFGHTKGDEVLILLTKLLSNSIRKSDMLARWGGEEFVILLPNTSLEQTASIAEKLRKKIENFTFCTEFTVTCSFGVTEVVECDTTESLFSRVDNVLYEAKQGGRNKVVVSHSTLK